MFGRKGREIAAQRAEIARLQAFCHDVSPHLETAIELAQNAKKLADPNSNLTDEERAKLTQEARAGGLAHLIAREFHGMPNSERIGLLDQLVGREAVLQMFREPLEQVSKSTIVNLLGGASIGEAVQMYKTFAGEEAFANLVGDSIAEQVALFSNPLDLDATRRYSEMCGNIATDQWRLGSIVRFNFDNREDPMARPTEITRSITVAVTPHKKRATLQVAKDTGPSTQDPEWRRYPLREGELITIGSYAHCEEKREFRAQVRVGDTFAYAYADTKKGSDRQEPERLVCVEMLNHATDDFEVVHGKLPKAQE